MQTLEQYSFTLLQEESGDSLYNDVSGIINQACLKAVLAAQNKKHDPIILSFAIKRNPDTYGTILLYENRAYFGVFGNDVLYNKASISSFEMFMDDRFASVLPERIYNQVQLVIQGWIAAQSIASAEIINAWNELIEKEKDQTVER